MSKTKYHYQLTSQLKVILRKFLKIELNSKMNFKINLYSNF